MSFDDCKKYVIFDELFYMHPDTLNSSTLEFIVTNMSKIRNYYFPIEGLGKPDNLIPVITSIVLTSIIASNINATLITNDFLKNNYLGRNESDMPRVLPVVFTHSQETGNLSEVWHQYFVNRKHKKLQKVEQSDQFVVKLPRFSFHKSSFMNFYYCDIPKKLKLSPWTFTLFTDPFGTFVWFNLIIIFSLVSLIIFVQVDRSEIGVSLMSMISSALSMGVVELPMRSKLFILWLFCSMLVVNFYSGSISSTLIRPLEDDSIKTWSDLQNRNFTFFTNDDYYVNLMRNELTAVKSKLSQTIRKLLQNVILDESSSFKNVMQYLLFQDNVFNINYWVGAIKIVNIDFEAKIRKQAQSDKRKAKRCRVGQELIFSSHIFYGFLPPDNEELFTAFQHITEAGIVELFTNEYHGMLLSNRVQDRVLVKSKTMVKPKAEATVAKLNLQGKVVTVLLLWMLCLLASFLSFFGEIIRFRLGLFKEIYTIFRWSIFAGYASLLLSIYCVKKRCAGLCQNLHYR